MIEYVTEKMSNLCYERAWYTKMGGCEAMSFFLENMSLRWVITHHFIILKSMFFVLTDLTGEVSAGAVDLAKKNVTRLVNMCATCSVETLHTVKQTCLSEMTLEFVKQLTSPISNVREESMKAIELLAELQGKTASAVVEPHNLILADMIPPKKHLIRHQSVQTQLGILDGNTFCISLEPRLFMHDVNQPEHRIFISELIALSEADDAALSKLPCYKNVTNLIPVRLSVMRCLGAICPGSSAPNRVKMLAIFMKGLCHPNTEIQNAAHGALRKYLDAGFAVEQNILTAAVRPILVEFTCFRSIKTTSLVHMGHLYRLFPQMFYDHVWHNMIQLLRKSLEMSIVAHLKTPSRNGMHEVNLAVHFLDLYEFSKPESIAYAEPVTKLALQAEKALSLTKGSPFRRPLMKFLLKSPNTYVSLVFSIPYIQMPEWARFFIYFLEQPEAGALREVVMAEPERLIKCLNVKQNPSIAEFVCNRSATASKIYKANPEAVFSVYEQSEIQFLAVKTMAVLSEYDDDWILGNGTNRGEVVQALRTLWESDDYQKTAAINILTIFHATKDLIPKMPPPSPAVNPDESEETPAIYLDENTTQSPEKAGPSTGSTPMETDAVVPVGWTRLQVHAWKEPQMVVRLLLSYYRKNPSDIDLLFKLLLVFCYRSISQYQFLKEFIEKTVTRYSISWKRMAFEKFVSIYADPDYPDELKAKIIQYILIPCASYCFDKGQGEEFIGGPPMPDVDSNDNLVSLFINKVIDPNNQLRLGDPHLIPDGHKTMSDSVRIALCQLSCLLLDQAAEHIHDVSNKKQGNKLKRLITFAWPCLLAKSCVDSSTKYYEHLLLCHVISKFAIHKRIVLQVFHSLLKASTLEAKTVVKQALEIITPALPYRMEDGHAMLIHWTKKILVEEGHSLSQLMHLLQQIVRHWKVYYPVRHMLVTHMTNAIQRLGFASSSTFEHRKLAVEVAEVIIKWELERIRNAGDTEKEEEPRTPETKKSKPSCAPPPQLEVSSIGSVKPLEKIYTDAVLNFLLRLACQVSRNKKVLLICVRDSLV